MVFVLISMLFLLHSCVENKKNIEPVLCHEVFAPFIKEAAVVFEGGNSKAQYGLQVEGLHNEQLLEAGLKDSIVLIIRHFDWTDAERAYFESRMISIESKVMCLSADEDPVFILLKLHRKNQSSLFADFLLSERGKILLRKQGFLVDLKAREMRIRVAD